MKPELLTINRDTFIRELSSQKIGTSVHFIPLHLHPYYRDRNGYKYGDFPNAEYIYERVISLPLYPKMKPSDIERVIDAVKTIIKKYKK